jgi:hypothetical protein
MATGNGETTEVGGGLSVDRVLSEPDDEEVPIVSDGTRTGSSSVFGSRVSRSASSGSTRLSFGRSSTSSNVSASGTWSFSENRSESVAI